MKKLLQRDEGKYYNNMQYNINNIISGIGISVGYNTEPLLQCYFTAWAFVGSSSSKCGLSVCTWYIPTTYCGRKNDTFRWNLPETSVTYRYT